MKSIEGIVDELRHKVADQDSMIVNTVSNITRDYLDKYKVTSDDA